MIKQFFTSVTDNKVLGIDIYNFNDMERHEPNFEDQDIEVCNGGDERFGIDGQLYLGYGCVLEDGITQMVSVYKFIGYMSAEDAKKLMKL